MLPDGWQKEVNEGAGVFLGFGREEKDIEIETSPRILTEEFIFDYCKRHETIM